MTANTGHYNIIKLSLDNEHALLESHLYYVFSILLQQDVFAQKIHRISDQVSTTV